MNQLLKKISILKFFLACFSCQKSARRTFIYYWMMHVFLPFIITGSSKLCALVTNRTLFCCVLDPVTNMMYNIKMNELPVGFCDTSSFLLDWKVIKPNLNLIVPAMFSCHNSIHDTPQKITRWGQRKQSFLNLNQICTTAEIQHSRLIASR